MPHRSRQLLFQPALPSNCPPMVIYGFADRPARLFLVEVEAVFVLVIVEKRGKASPVEESPPCPTPPLTSARASVDPITRGFGAISCPRTEEAFTVEMD